MTREIKFRGWDGQNIIEPELMIIYLGCGWKENETLDGTAIHIDEHIENIMQFTGLKDKNGKEIYEHMELDGLFEVSFKDCCYVLINISTGDIVGLSEYMEGKNDQVEITREYTKV